MPKMKRVDVDFGIGADDQDLQKLIGVGENNNNADIIYLKKILGRVIQGEFTQRQREIIYMYYFDRLTYAEIGERLALTPQGVGGIVKAAKARIHKVMRYYFDSLEFSDIWSICCLRKEESINRNPIPAPEQPKIEKQEKIEIKKSDSTILKIAKALLNLGISPNTKGYHYLREGIMICATSEDHMPIFSKQIYSQLAKSYNTSECSIERAVRHAIKSGWYRRNEEQARMIFMNTLQSTNDIPTNSVFIATVVEWIKITQI